MIQEELLTKLNQVEKLANGSKVSRLLHDPIKYISAIVFRKLVYKIQQKEAIKRCTIFTGRTMHVFLPAATDIYLTGGKSHASEIHLAKFLILNLKSGDTFWDIGAHYGYFSMIASELIGATGHIIAVEAAPKTLNILQANSKAIANMQVFNKAVSKSLEPITFYEFPNLYSEFNTTDITQFEKADWFKTVEVKQNTLETITFDSLYEKKGSASIPTIIKMDVEGGEFAAIEGAKVLFETESPILVMEFVEAKRDNKPHIQAQALLQKMQYFPYRICADGSLEQVSDIEAYLNANQLESDNIVFKKQTATH